MHIKKFLTVILFITQVTIGLGQNSHEISLDGVWKFVTDSLNTGLKNGFSNNMPRYAKPVLVPHTWNVQIGTENYAGKGWYYKNINAPLAWRGKAMPYFL